jgi:hypothetical protein
MILVPWCNGFLPSHSSLTETQVYATTISCAGVGTVDLHSCAMGLVDYELVLRTVVPTKPSTHKQHSNLLLGRSTALHKNELTSKIGVFRIVTEILVVLRR